MEGVQASKWYRWLWWSPLLTVPTLIAFLFNDIGYDLVCNSYSKCDWSLAERVSWVIAVLGSALWHLLLLIPARDKQSAFVRWHGRQALFLAGLRTVVPLYFILKFGIDFETLLFIPVLILIWLFGTLWGQNQAERGDCSLARWFGRADELPGPALDVDSMLKIIRYSRDPEERHKALFKLKELGVVEEL